MATDVLLVALVVAVFVQGWLIQRDIRRATLALLRGMEEMMGSRKNRP
jgi:hypothetical protein